MELERIKEKLGEAELYIDQLEEENNKLEITNR